MARWGKNSSYTYTGRKKKTFDQNTGGLATSGVVSSRISRESTAPNSWEFYEIELAEVMFVYDTIETLPKDGDGNPLWALMGAIKARNQESDKGKLRRRRVGQHRHWVRP